MPDFSERALSNNDMTDQPGKGPVKKHLKSADCISDYFHDKSLVSSCRDFNFKWWLLKSSESATIHNKFDDNSMDFYSNDCEAICDNITITIPILEIRMLGKQSGVDQVSNAWIDTIL